MNHLFCKGCLFASSLASAARVETRGGRSRVVLEYGKSASFESSSMTCDVGTGGCVNCEAQMLSIVDSLILLVGATESPVNGLRCRDCNQLQLQRSMVTADVTRLTPSASITFLNSSNTRSVEVSKSWATCESGCSVIASEDVQTIDVSDAFWTTHASGGELFSADTASFLIVTDSLNLHRVIVRHSHFEHQSQWSPQSGIRISTDLGLAAGEILSVAETRLSGFARPATGSGILLNTSIGGNAQLDPVITVSVRRSLISDCQARFTGPALAWQVQQAAFSTRSAVLELNDTVLVNNRLYSAYARGADVFLSSGVTSNVFQGGKQVSLDVAAVFAISSATLMNTSQAALNGVCSESRSVPNRSESAIRDQVFASLAAVQSLLSTMGATSATCYAGEVVIQPQNALDPTSMRLPASCQTCPGGTVFVWDRTTVPARRFCLACPPGVVCYGGNHLQVKRGYFLFSLQDAAVQPFPHHSYVPQLTSSTTADFIALQCPVAAACDGAELVTCGNVHVGVRSSWRGASSNTWQTTLQFESARDSPQDTAAIWMTMLRQLLGLLSTAASTSALPPWLWQYLLAGSQSLNEADAWYASPWSYDAGSNDILLPACAHAGDVKAFGASLAALLPCLARQASTDALDLAIVEVCVTQAPSTSITTRFVLRGTTLQECYALEWPDTTPVASAELYPFAWSRHGCHTERGYEGPLCARCRSQFTKATQQDFSITANCDACGAGWYLALRQLGTLFVAASVLLLITFRRLCKPISFSARGPILRIMFLHVQWLSVVRLISARWPSWLSDIFSVLGAASASQYTDSYAASCLMEYQRASQTASVAFELGITVLAMSSAAAVIIAVLLHQLRKHLKSKTRMQDNLPRTMSRAFRKLHLDAQIADDGQVKAPAILDISNEPQRARVRGTMAAKLAGFIPRLDFSHVSVKENGSRPTLREAATPLLKAVIASSVLAAYTSIVRCVLKLFVCTTIAKVGNFAALTGPSSPVAEQATWQSTDIFDWRLEYDLSARCMKGDHLFWVLVLLPFSVIFVFGTPCLMALALYRRRHKLMHHNTLRWYGWMYRGLRMNTWWWGVGHLCWTLAFVAWIRLSRPSGPQAQAGGAIMILLLRLVATVVVRPYTSSIVTSMEAASICSLVAATSAVFLLTADPPQRIDGDAFDRMAQIVLIASQMLLVGGVVMVFRSLRASS